MTAPRLRGDAQAIAAHSGLPLADVQEAFDACLRVMDAPSPARGILTVADQRARALMLATVARHARDVGWWVHIVLADRYQVEATIETLWAHGMENVQPGRGGRLRISTMHSIARQAPRTMQDEMAPTLLIGEHLAWGIGPAFLWALERHHRDTWRLGLASVPGEQLPREAMVAFGNPAFADGTMGHLGPTQPTYRVEIPRWTGSLDELLADERPTLIIAADARRVERMLPGRAFATRDRLPGPQGFCDGTVNLFVAGRIPGGPVMTRAQRVLFMGSPTHENRWAIDYYGERGLLDPGLLLQLDPTD